MRVLLLIPPMTQLNTPYPATAYLTGFLKSRGYEVVQDDPALKLALSLFSPESLSEVGALLSKRSHRRASLPIVQHFLQFLEEYRRTVGPVVQFLQGKDPSLGLRIISRSFLPEGPRFAVLQEKAKAFEGDPLLWAFGTLGVQDQAKFLASLYMDDLADLFRAVDPRFELSRYGEKLAASQPTFEPLKQALEGELTLVDRNLERIALEIYEKARPDCVGITVPFPGNVYGAFRIAQCLKKKNPKIPFVLGGGYVNTELRDLKEPRVFDYFDYVCLDDGERPWLALLDHLEGKTTKNELYRTFVREDGKVVLKSDQRLHDIPHRDVGVASYEGLPLSEYLSLFEMLNPMHRLWSDGRWNKITLAHGCYWKKCSFCDVSLDYIGRYETAPADLLIDRIEEIIRQTGQRGFHFVDEAAPPALLKNLALRLIERGVSITWWGNIRFEKAFTAELAELLARSGCVAVSGGLEVASDRLLKLMQKGVTVEQVARVSHAFSNAGVMVHAYLMYGFPTQTVQETVDALERVKQLFAQGCIHSAFWHRFSVTAHSPVGKNPKDYGITLHPEPKISFARNDLAFDDPTGVDHDRLGVGLRKALYNYMHGVGLEEDVTSWFDNKVPKTKVKKRLIVDAIKGTP